MQNLTLLELGDCYAEDAQRLSELARACEDRRRLALRQGDSREAARQERLHELHRQQRNDLLRLSGWLRHYYDDTRNPTPAPLSNGSDAA